MNTKIENMNTLLDQCGESLYLEMTRQISTYGCEIWLQSEMGEYVEKWALEYFDGDQDKADLFGWEWMESYESGEIIPMDWEEAIIEDELVRLETGTLYPGQYIDPIKIEFWEDWKSDVGFKRIVGIHQMMRGHCYASSDWTDDPGLSLSETLRRIVYERKRPD